MVSKDIRFTGEQSYAPAVCADCQERLGWVAVSENMKDFTFELHDCHPGCPAKVGDHDTQYRDR